VPLAITAQHARCISEWLPPSVTVIQSPAPASALSARIWPASFADAAGTSNFNSRREHFRSFAVSTIIGNSRAISRSRLPGNSPTSRSSRCTPGSRFSSSSSTNGFPTKVVFSPAFSKIGFSKGNKQSISSNTRAITGIRRLFQAHTFGLM